MFTYILGFTGFAALVSGILELLNGKKRHFWPVIVSAIAMAVINWAIVYFLMPPFSHWLSGGWPLMFFVNLIGPALISLVGLLDDYEYSSKGGSTGIIFAIVLLFAMWVVSLFMPPAACNTDQIRQWADILHLEETTESAPNTDLANIIRVPASVALSKAGNALSSGENAALGNYLQPNRAYIQYVQGRPVYAIDLKITDWIAFRQAGSLIPGYQIVDANDQNAPVEFHLGYQIQFAPYARWNKDLDRRVYLDYLLGTSYRIDDLDGMEIDDNFYPMYYGTVMAHVMGYKGIEPVGLYGFNPQTGEGTPLTLEQKPEWLDRVYSLEWTVKYVKLWAQFYNHNACSWTALGEEKLDWQNDVTIPGGLEYQFTTTSMGKDPSLVHLITVNPTTGQGKIYSVEGKTIEGIRAMVGQASKTLNPAGYTVDECEIHHIFNTDTVYCILTYDSGGDVAIGGYSFIDVKMAMNNNLEDIAIATTFDEAAYKYQEILARAGGEMSLANTQTDIQITGTVMSNVWVNYGGEAGSYLINVQEDNGQSYWMLARGSSLNAAAAQPGTTVTATCYQQVNQNYLTVRYIRVEGIPDLDNK